MNGRFFVLLILISAMMGACTADGSDGEPTQTAVPATEEEGNEMSEDVNAGLPEPLDIRLERRDVEPLPANALLKFQVISRGPNPNSNYRWLLYEDGKWYVAWHSDDSSDWETPFDTPLPDTPTRTLPAAVVREVKRQLEEASFTGEPRYQADETMEDGSFYVVTARIDGKQYEVIYEGLYPPLVEYLDSIAWTYQ